MQYSKRYAGVLSAVGLVASMVLADAASAQSCHAPSLREPTETGFHVGFVAVAATFSDVEHGDYQGIIPTLTWHHPWVTADVALPWYRLNRDQQEAIGLGDLATDVRVALFRTDSAGFAFGPELAVSFPTGNAEEGLGMGHVMVMPGAWARLELANLSIMGQLGWGRALADADAHAQHAGHAGHEGHPAEAMHATPRVNPMNMNELEHALGIRYAVHPNVALTARWLGGIPLDDMGVARQVIGPGLQLTADALDATIEALVPIAGDPFDVRVSFWFGALL
jgi:hypothetical protein